MKKGLLFTGLATMAAGSVVAEEAPKQQKQPNIILMMADDLGYGDTGFNGNKTIMTPEMDKMAKNGAIFTNFHAGGPVCSPTRGTLLTGRHYARYGIFYANKGHMPKQEIMLSEVLKSKGYATGHFGKWHLGTLDKNFSAKGKGRKPAENFSPPSWHSYDRSFVTESACRTWDPGYGSLAKRVPFYDDGKRLEATDENNLKGGAARVVVDRVIPFMRKANQENKPFFAVIWFHAPHMETEAGPKYLEMYKDQPEGARHYYGCITEMDEQIGRLRNELKTLGVDDNTLLAFTSDNGPAGKNVGDKNRLFGVTDGLRSRKTSLYEGGVRVPTLLEWPGHVKPGTVTNALTSTLDYFPTITEMVDYKMPDNRPIDGVSMLELLEGREFKRPKAVPFFSVGKATLIDGDMKIYGSPRTGEYELYNLAKDRGEQTDIIAQHPEKATAMKARINEFLASAKKSHSGADYNDSTYKPVDPWPGDKKKKAKKKGKKKKNK